MLLMAKIKKLEYVNVEILAYPPQHVKYRGLHRGEDGEEFCLSQVQSAGSRLTFKKRSRITDFNEGDLADCKKVCRDLFDVGANEHVACSCKDHV